MAPPSWPIIQPNFRLNSIGVTRVFVWDAENRLVEVRNAAGDATIATYTYDHLSRRIRKTTISGTPQNATDTTYHYDGWNLIAEYSGATLKKTYLWGMDLSGTIQGAGGVGGLLSVSDLDATTGHVTASYYPTFDGNGNVSEYLNGSGTPVAHYEYDPFGNDITPDSSSLAKNDDFSHRFSTKLLDQETGLYYYGYRYYDPLTGRWPSRDPIGEKGGFNLYGFVGNDGMNDTDYLGLKICYRWMFITFFGDENGSDGKSASGKKNKLGQTLGKDLDAGDAADANHRYHPDGTTHPHPDPKADLNRPYKGWKFRIHRGTKGMDNRTVNDNGAGWVYPRAGLPDGVDGDEWLDLWIKKEVKKGGKIGEVDKNNEWDVVETDVPDKCDCPEGWYENSKPPDPVHKTQYEDALKAKAKDDIEKGNEEWKRRHPGK